MRLDPFRLFRKQVETAELYEYTVDGKDNVKLADIRVIAKRTTGTDAPTESYESRITTRRIHIMTKTLPEDLQADVESLVNLIIEMDDHAFQIQDVSRGDDMTLGTTEFVTVKAAPFGRDSI